ncbi:transposase [Streptomyces sp. LNU-CPARS28]|uniref:transposase n=1 Tax=Streptomyces sp. LNU-CPARS28 TaxID=3137371 RepID=UPI00313709DB
MTEPVHHMLAARDLLPAEHFLDSGYASAELIVGGRTLSLQPRELQEVLDHARLQQDDEQWRARYGTRAGIEGAIHQAVAVTGMRRARYLGLQKTHLEHVFSAVALNLIRLDAWWNGHPLDRTRVSHLARLDLSLAA